MSVTQARLLLIFGLLALWELLPLLGVVDSFFISRPDLILQRIWEWTSTGALFGHIFATVSEASIGFVIGTVAGAAVGLFCGLWPPASRALLPLLTIGNALPKLAFAPLLIAWFGFGISSKIALSAAVVFFFIFFGVYSGLRSGNGLIVANARVMGGSGWKLLWHVHLPSAFSWIIAGIRLAVGYAFASAVIGEYLGSDVGLGYLITYGKAMLDMTQVFAGLVVVMLLAGLADVALRRVADAGSHWRDASA